MLQSASATILSIKKAFKEIKSFCSDAWEGDYRTAAREALKQILEGRMKNAVDAYLEHLSTQEIPDRRNGSYRRHLLTELGDIELQVPRTRTFNPIRILQRFSRRAAQVERMILMAFVLGLSTRKVSKALLPILGEPISAATVSAVAKQLDAAVLAYQRRPLMDQYQVLILDGVVLKRRTGAGAQKRVVLVALGIREDGKKEIIDFRQASSESASAWEAFLNSLYHRGLTGSKLKLILTDGGSGLRAALPLVFGLVPIQCCWAHKTRNVLNQVKKIDQPAVKKDLHRISHTKNELCAQRAAKQFIVKWQERYPKAVACLLSDLPELLTFFRTDLPLRAEELRTTNAIERRFREVRRRTRPMGTFSDATSIDRILFAVFTYENHQQEVGTPFLLTHNS